MAVHGVGNVCLDTTFRVVRFPRAGETLNAQGCAVGLGGKGANQALAALRTGAETRLWAPIGRDAEAETIRHLIEQAGLDPNGLVTVDAPSDRSSILLDGSAENLIVSAVAAARCFEADRAGWLEAARPGDVVVMQNNLKPAATAACLAEARKRRLFTIFNASPLETEPAPALGGLDLVVVNRDEGEALTGETEPAAILAALLGQGATRAVVTLGRGGAVMASDDGRLAVAAPPVAAIDTSGAGDVLCGTLAGLLDRKIPEPRALRAAIRAAAHSVTRPGTFGCGPSRTELDAILKETP